MLAPTKSDFTSITESPLPEPDTNSHYARGSGWKYANNIADRSEDVGTNQIKLHT